MDEDIKAEPVGDLLNAMGVKYYPREGELVSGVLVILRVIAEDGTEYLRHAGSDQMSWIERIGLVRITEQLLLDDLSHYKEN